MARKDKRSVIRKHETTPAELYYGKDLWLHGHFIFTNEKLIFTPSDRAFKAIKINYTDIIWCEEYKNVFGRNNTFIITKEKKEYNFSAEKIYPYAGFLKPLINPVEERPVTQLYEETQTGGEKIRRQHFNGPICCYCGIMIPILLVLIFDELMKNGLQIALEELKGALLIIAVWGIIFSILSMLNRKNFGEIICTLDHSGIHYKNELIPWNSIREIEYEIVLPSRSVMASRIRNCYAHVKGENNVIILSAPYYLLQRAAEYNPAIKTGFSKHSKGLLKLFAGAILVFMIAMLGVVM